MLTILRQLCLTVLSFAALYASLIAVSFMVYPNRSEKALDTGSAEQTIYTTPTKYLYFGRTLLEAPGRRVFVVGASNADAGLRPSQVQEEVSCATVHGLTIGNMNVAEMEQTIGLIPASRSLSKSDTVVLGIWYGNFADSRDRWHDRNRALGESDVEVELYRFGFYHQGRTGPEASISDRWLFAEALSLRPLHMFEGLLRRLTSTARNAVFVRPPTMTLAEREKRTFKPDEKVAALQYWQQQFGSNTDVSDAQFAILERTITDILARGSRVVLVDLPIPAWNADASRFELGYRKRLAALIPRFAGARGFSFLTMPDLVQDDHFSDEVHPKPSTARIWATRVGRAVDVSACPLEHSAQN